MRHMRSTVTKVVPSPKGVKIAKKFLNGFSTQMLPISSPVLLKVLAIPSRSEFTNIPYTYRPMIPVMM